MVGAGQCSRPFLVGVILICSLGQLLGVEQDQEDEDEDAPTEDPDGTTQSTKTPIRWAAETVEDNPALKSTTQRERGGDLTGNQKSDAEIMKGYYIMQEEWKKPPVHHDPFKVEFHMEKLDPPSSEDPFNTTGIITIQVVPRWAYRAAHRFKELIEAKYLDNSYMFEVCDGYIHFGSHGAEKSPQNKYWNDRPIGIDQAPTNFDDIAATALKRGVISFSEVNFQRRTKMVMFQKDLAESGNTQLRPFAKVISGFGELDRVHSTGKPAPEGNGPSLDWFNMKGDGYLKTNFPETSLIRKAVILGATTTTTTDDIQWRNPIVECETNKGNFKIELHDISSTHTSRFMDLVRLGYYSDNVFHHVMWDSYMKFGISPNEEMRDEWRGLVLAEEYKKNGNKNGCERGQVAFTGGKNQKSTMIMVISKTHTDDCPEVRFKPFGIIKGVESFQTIDHINGEYGVVPDEGQIYRDGKEYLNKFGRLDRIRRCEIANDRLEWGMGAEYLKPDEPYDLTLGPRSIFCIVFGICAVAIGVAFFLTMTGSMKENGDEEIYKKV